MSWDRRDIMASRYVPTIFSVTFEAYIREKIVCWFYAATLMPTRGRARRNCDRNGVYKGKPKLNVKKMVDRWLPLMLQLATAHDRDGQDQAEAALDELLAPLLACPVRQLREFYAALTEGMKKDQRFPMVCWRVFEAWGEKILKEAPDESIMELKRSLAEDIVELAEQDAKDQLPEAMIRALMWRPPETLKQVKKALKDGGKASMVGRESCLYLEVTPRGRRKATAKVML